MPEFFIDDGVQYRTRDGKLMAETPAHRDVMANAIEGFKLWYAGRHDVYFSGGMMMYYIKGDPETYISSDVFMVLDIPDTYRDVYCTWLEPKSTLDLVIENTSRSTAKEDLVDKLDLYANVLKVQEYVLFDPFQEYLEPSVQLLRLKGNKYVPVDPIDGRLPSAVTGLHFERYGRKLLFWDPRTARHLQPWLKREQVNDPSPRPFQKD